MTEHRYPSAEFPGPLALRVRAPEGWRPWHAAGTAMAFVDEHSPEGTPTNLIFVVNRVSGEPTLDDIAAFTRKHTGDAGGAVTTLGSEVRTVDGRPAIRTIVRIDITERQLSLVQAQTVFSVPAPAGDLLDVVAVHLTCRADVWDAKVADLDEILSTVRIGDE